MQHYVRLVSALSRACGVAAAALILVSVAVIAQMIFIRFVLNQSAIWQTEFVTFSLVAATFIGSPYVLLLRGHVNVDLLPLILGHRGRLILAFAAALMSLAFCLLLLWFSVEWWYEAYGGGWVTSSMWRARLWIPYASMPFGLAVLCLQYFADIYSLATGRDMPFGLRPEDRL